MRLWAVTYDPPAFPDGLYEQGITLLDVDSQDRIRRFYRREDACRCLIGRLLPRMLLKERGVSPAEMSFSATPAGKPYVNTTTPKSDRPFEFNVSHDNALIVMAFASGQDDPAHHSPCQVGVDVMRVALPGRESLESFIQIVGNQLTSLERRVLFTDGDAEGLRRFYWIWTMKEAYSKALGLGLGFNFRRIEYDVTAEEVRVDGVSPKGWRFSKFELMIGSDTYQGVVANCTGRDEVAVVGMLDTERITERRGNDFVRDAITELQQ